MKYGYQLSLIGYCSGIYFCYCKMILIVGSRNVNGMFVHYFSVKRLDTMWLVVQNQWKTYKCDFQKQFVSGWYQVSDTDQLGLLSIHQLLTIRWLTFSPLNLSQIAATHCIHSVKMSKSLVLICWYLYFMIDICRPW